ncbi:MAG: DUF881 domain-containing protein [Clostridiales bacterium]|nr:DUF881 domain-containing protein [Clostridiales bacterium]
MKKKNNIVILFLSFIFIGAVLGIYFGGIKELREVEFNLPLSEFETEEIITLRKENIERKEKIEELYKEVKEHEELLANQSFPLRELRNEVERYKLLSGQIDVSGPGMTVTIEGSFGENIATLVEQRKYLVRLVNELKVFGAEAISINNYRITARSEVTLAGNHINVNMTAIAPPYVICAIGNSARFGRYVSFHTLIFEEMAKDGLKVNIEFHEELVISSIIRERPIQFLEPFNEY